MRLYLRLAWRNIWRHKRRTLIVALAIGLSLSMMMMYDGMIAGFNDAIYANAIKVLGGNIQIHADGYGDSGKENPLIPLADDQAVVAAAEANPTVALAARRITTGGMASNREGAFGVSIVGIEPEKEQGSSLLAQNVVAGSFLSSSDMDVVFIGKGLADQMSVTVGDRVTLVGRGTHEQTRQRTMTVGGIYDLKMPDIEKRTVYISLGEAQELYGLRGQSTEVALMLKQLGQEKNVIGALRPGLPAYEINSWEENYPEMLAAINTKGGVMNVFGVIIVVIAGIGILNLLLMAVFERTREIGLLGALGMKPAQISFLFLLEGAMMALVGLAVGIGLGLLFNGLLGSVGLDYSKFSGVTEYTALINGRIFPSLGVENLWQRAVTILIISVLAAYYPAREASRSEPAQALHYV